MLPNCPPQFSLQDDTVLFGLDLALDEYKDMLEKANCFLGIRTHLEQDYLKMKSLSLPTFHRGTKKQLFKKNIRRLIQQGPGSEALMPLLYMREDENMPVNVLFLACFSLSDHHFRRIEDHGLNEKFPFLLQKVISINNISATIMQRLVAIVREICGTDETSTSILEAVNRAFPHTSVTRTSGVIAIDKTPIHDTATFTQRKRGSQASYEQPVPKFPAGENLQFRIALHEASPPVSTVHETSHIFGVDANANPPAPEHQSNATNYYQPQVQRIPPNIYNMIGSRHGGLAREEVSHQNDLELAFLVPPGPLDIFYELHKNSRASRQHSAILTIPTQDRVASLILSIPRTEAVAESAKQTLPVIFNSEPPSV